MAPDLTREEFLDYLKAREELKQIRREMKKQGYPLSHELHGSNLYSHAFRFPLTRRKVKITTKDKFAIHLLYQTKRYTHKDLAKRYGISPSYTGQILQENKYTVDNSFE